MLKWKIENNVISSLSFEGMDLINPWGVETADSWAFYSMEKNIGYRYQELAFTRDLSDAKYTTSQHIKMKEGEWKLSTTDEIIDHSVIRTAELVCVEDSILMDFVVRFRFKKKYFNQAMIADQKIPHTMSNVYHQYVTNEATLEGENLKLTVNIIGSETSGRFTPHLYVRDHQDEWVVHARMIPNSSDKDVIKLCSKYFATSPLPNIMTKSFLSFSNVKDYLWYHSEHSPYKNRLMKFFSPNAFPMIRLKKGQSLKWRVGVKIERR